jgi:hypothetical protein
MAIAFHTFSQVFKRHESKTFQLSVDFGNTIKSADVAIKGIDVAHHDQDHEIETIKANISNVQLSPSKTAVNFDLHYEVSDKNQHEMEGTITALVIADVEAKMQKEPTVTVLSAK